MFLKFSIKNNVKFIKCTDILIYICITAFIYIFITVSVGVKECIKGLREGLGTDSDR